MDHRAVRYAVLVRELGRSAKRWQTYYLRVLLAAGGLLALLIARAAVGDQTGAWATGAAGARVFTWVAWINVALVGLLSPILVADALVEDPSTQDLTTLARIRPHQIVLGKLASQAQLMLVPVLGGTLPVLVLTWAHGGVPPVRLAIVLWNTGAVAVLLGLVAAWARLRGAGRVGAVVVALGSAPVVLVALPVVVELSGSMPRFGPTWFLNSWTFPGQTTSPLLALTRSDWRGWVAPLALTPLLIHLVADTIRLTRCPTDLGFRNDFTMRLGYWLVGLVPGPTITVILLPMMWLLQLYPQPPSTPSSTVWWALWMANCAFVIWLMAPIYLDFGVWMANVGLFRRFTERINKHDGGPRRLMSDVVWRNPVAWREVATRFTRISLIPTVGSVTAQLGAFAMAVLFVAALGSAGGSSGVALVARSLAIGGWILVIWGLFLGTVAAARSGIEERHGRVLELLVLTTLPSRRVVLGKLAVPALVGLPAILLGWSVSHGALLLFVHKEIPSQVASQAAIQELVHDATLLGFEAASALALAVAAWALLALIGLAVSIRLGDRPSAWTLILLLALPVVLVVFAGPGKLWWSLGVGPGQPGHSDLLAAVVATGQLQFILFGSLVVASVTVFAILATRLRRWAVATSG